MSEVETPVEHRLREMAEDAQCRIGACVMDHHCASCGRTIEIPTDVLGAGREAIALLREYKDGRVTWLAFDGRMRQLLARCGGQEGT